MGSYEDQRNACLKPYVEDPHIEYVEIFAQDSAGNSTSVTKMYRHPEPVNPPPEKAWHDTMLVETIMHDESGLQRNVPRQPKEKK
jgi:hypothetical protein